MVGGGIGAATARSGDGVLVSYLVITYNRADEVVACIESIEAQDWPDKEIIVVDNASRDETPALLGKIAAEGRIRFKQSATNLGVAGGRNEAIAMAGGDVLVTLDDDAAFTDAGATRRIVEAFAAAPDVGVLAFRIQNFVVTPEGLVPDASRDRWSLPWRDKTRPRDETFETTWFIGAGHAFRRAVYETVGLYHNFNPYAGEEIDLALRVVDAGFRILYFPPAEIIHKVVDKGRIDDPTALYALRLKHRIKIAAINLPWYSIATYMLVRTVHILLRTRGNVRAVVRGYAMLLGDRDEIRRDRKVIGPEARRKLRALRGPLYY